MVLSFMWSVGTCERSGVGVGVGGQGTDKWGGLSDSGLIICRRDSAVERKSGVLLHSDAHFC